MLVAARGVQGVGGAVMAAVAFAIVISTFTDAGERARALGVWGFTASGGGSIGVLLGGVLTASLSWHWIFLVNVPIGIAVFVLAPRLLDPDPVAETRPRVDVPGAVTIASGLAIGVYAIVGAVDRGWGDPVTIALLALAVALVVAFIVIERRTAEPLVPFDLFHSRSFTVANALSVLVVAGMFGWFFFGALYLQEVLGFSTLQTGLAFLPATLALGFLSIGLSARIAMTIGVRRALVIGLLLGGAGVLLLARTSATGTYIVDVLPSQLLIGVGIGMAFMPIFMILTSDVAPELSGLASGVMQTVQQFGGALGLAALTAIAASRSAGSGEPSGSPEALLAGYHGAFLVGAVALLLAAIGAAVLLPAQKGAAVAHEHQETPV
jgi:EmrB/QacA subfamily drug resistance transporter